MGDAPAPTVITVAGGAVTRRTNVSQGSGDAWNQLTWSVSLVCQTCSQWSRS